MNHRKILIYEHFRSKIKEIMLKIPEIVELELYSETVPLVREKPFNTMLIKELMRYNSLLKVIRSNLHATYAA